MLKHLDLFSGIGGFSLGLERTKGFKTVAFCEIDGFCQRVLNRHWPRVPIYDDVRSLEYDGPVDIITGGYPCQPFSVAGDRKGQEDDRHLWPAMFELIKKHRPTWVIGENVAGHINMGLDDVLADLESEGYKCRAFVIPACAVNAPHRRDRVWIVGNTEHNGSLTTEERGKSEKTSNNNQERQKQASKLEGAGGPKHNEDVANSHQQRSQGRKVVQCSDKLSLGKRGMARYTSSARFPDWSKGEMGQPSPLTQFERPDGREVEYDFCGIPHGVSNRVDRLKSLGNAVVPQIPEIIGHAILEAENE